MSVARVLPSSFKPRTPLRAYAYAIATTAIVILFALAEWWTERVVSQNSRIASTTIELTIVVVATFAFRPVHQWVENTVEAAFTRRRREARAAVYRLMRELSSFNDKAQVMRRVVDAVDHYLEAAGCAIFLRSEKYEAAASSFNTPLESVAPEGAFAIRLRSSHGPVNPRSFHHTAIGSIACPMTARGELIGFLVAAPKNEYEPDDRQILAALAEAAGLTLASLDPGLLQASAPAAAPVGNLPLEIASLIGREGDVARVCKLLETHRLVTLKGPGGMGKTRLALRVARDWRTKSGDSAWFVDLSAVTNSESLLSQLTDALGVQQVAGKTLIQDAIAFLQPLNALIIIDNCEHLVHDVGHLASKVLERCSGLRLLCTSRESLALQGESVYTVPELPAQEALELFYERASEVAAGLDTAQAVRDDVAQILKHLDGVPYAIELAAARLRLMSPHELASHLGQRFDILNIGKRTALPRQQTLHAMIDWSYGLLSADEKVLFKRLVVFPRDFGLHAAAEICGFLPLSGSEAIALLGNLVDKSLVQAEAGPDGRRLRLLEATRAYASKQVTQTELEKLRQRHADFFSKVVQTIADPNVTHWDTCMRLLNTDIENVYASMNWALEKRRLDVAVEMAELLRAYWFHYVQLRTGREWFNRILQLEDGLDEAQRAAMHNGLAAVLLFSDPTGSLQSAQIAAEIYGKTGDFVGAARAMTILGNSQRSLGKYDEARASYEEGVRLYEQIHDERANVVAGSLAALLTDCCPGEYEKAQELYERALESTRRSGKRSLEGVTLGNMGQLALLRGQFEEAHKLATQSVSIARESNTPPVVATFLLVVASCAWELGKTTEARSALTEALSLFTEIGDDDPEHTSDALDASIEFAVSQGRFGDAAELYRIADAYRAHHRAPRLPATQARFDAIIDRLKSHLADRASKASREDCVPTASEALAVALSAVSAGR